MRATRWMPIAAGVAAEPSLATRKIDCPR